MEWRGARWWWWRGRWAWPLALMLAGLAGLALSLRRALEGRLGKRAEMRKKGDITGWIRYSCFPRFCVVIPPFLLVADRESTRGRRLRRSTKFCLFIGNCFTSLVPQASLHLSVVEARVAIMYASCNIPRPDAGDRQAAPQARPQQQPAVGQTVSLPSIQEFDNTVQQMKERQQKEFKENVDPASATESPFALPPSGIQVDFAPRIPASSVTQPGTVSVMAPGVEMSYQLPRGMVGNDARTNLVSMAEQQPLPTVADPEAVAEGKEEKKWREYVEALEWVSLALRW